MANLGWFILGYLAVGYIIDVLVTIAMVFYAGYKDSKYETENPEKTVNKDYAIKELVYCFGKIDDICNMDENPKKMKIKLWLITRIIWPVAVPIGAKRLLDSIKDAERCL